MRYEFLQDQISECQTLPYIERAELYEKIDLVRQILGIRLKDYPIDFNDVYAELSDVLSISYEPFTYKKFCGLLIRNKLPYASHVVINSNLTPADQYFAMVHELVHFFCHNLDRFMCNPFTNVVYGKFEWQANEGAAELILPRKFFVEDFNISMQEYGDINKAIKNTAKVYKVNEQVVKYRLMNLQDEFLQYKNM